MFGQLEYSLQAIHLLGRDILENRRLDVYEVDKGAHGIQIKRFGLSRQAIKDGQLATEASELIRKFLGDMSTLKASISKDDKAFDVY